MLGNVISAGIVGSNHSVNEDQSFCQWETFRNECLKKLMGSDKGNKLSPPQLSDALRSLPDTGPTAAWFTAGEGRTSASKLVNPLFSMEVIFTTLKILCWHEYQVPNPIVLSKPLGHLVKNWLTMKRFVTLRKVQERAGVYCNLLIVSALVS